MDQAPRIGALSHADLDALQMLHHVRPGGISWLMTADGIAIGGDVAHGTPGDPITVRRVWSWFGQAIRDAAQMRGVPVELLVAIIATETAVGERDRVTVRCARREMPGWRTDAATPDLARVGCMQTTLFDASRLAGRLITGHDLTLPEVSIDLGAFLIRQQKKLTHFDPPLVAAAYNVGGLHDDPGEGNRWRLLCDPPGTGEYINRFVKWFGDAMRVGRALPSLAGDAPSFAREVTVLV